MTYDKLNIAMILVYLILDDMCAIHNFLLQFGLLCHYYSVIPTLCDIR